MNERIQALPLTTRTLLSATSQALVTVGTAWGSGMLGEEEMALLLLSASLGPLPFKVSDSPQVVTLPGDHQQGTRSQVHTGTGSYTPSQPPWPAVPQSLEQPGCTGCARAGGRHRALGLVSGPLSLPCLDLCDLGQLPKCLRTSISSSIKWG